MFKVACSYMALYGREGGPSSEGGVTHGLHVVQAEVEAWVQMMEVGPWTSQKWAKEIC